MTRPWIIAHRGASSLAPENTLEALRLAAELGADRAEIDVQLTRDGVPVLLHDATVDRTTSGRGRIAELDWREADRLGIPSLEAALATAAEVGLPLAIELKNHNRPRELAEAVGPPAAASGIDRWYWSFHTDHLRYVAELDPGQTRGALSFGPPTAELRAEADLIIPLLAHLGIVWPPLIRREAKPMIAWMVDQRFTARRLARRGIAGLITNRLERILPLFAADTGEGRPAS